jgi:hypothetical protein
LRKKAGAKSSTDYVISTIARARTLRVAGLVAGGIAVAGSAVVVTASAAGYNFNFGRGSTPPSTAGLASNPTAAAGASSLCTDFEQHFVSDLGSTQTKVDAAFQQAIAETLADEVKAGKLTQAQADAIKARLAGKQPCAIGPSLAPGPGAKLPAYTQQLLTAAASALDVTPDVLKADLAKGMTLSQVAAAHNPPITEDQFRSKLIANLKPLLDQAVKDGTLTSDQEQAILKRLQTGAIPFWDKPMKRSTAAGTT